MEYEDLQELDLEHLDEEVDSDNNKENEIVQPKQKRQSKTTDAQYQKLFGFMNDHNEALMTKDASNILWETYASKLNDIGPPYHTSSEWKKIWTIYKKRIQFEPDVGTNNEPRIGADQPMDNTGTTDETLEHIPPTHAYRSPGLVLEGETSNCIDSQAFAAMVELHSAMIRNQNSVIEQIKVLIEKLDISNSLLEKIVNKP